MRRPDTEALRTCLFTLAFLLLALPVGAEHEIHLQAGGVAKLMPVDLLSRPQQVEIDVPERRFLAVDLVRSEPEGVRSVGRRVTDLSNDGLLLRAYALPAAGRQSVEGELRFHYADGTVAQIPIVLRVSPSFWGRWGAIALALAILLTGLPPMVSLTLSRFLPSPRSFTNRLQPVRRNDQGDLEAEPTAEVLRLPLRTALSPPKRIANWLRANPYRSWLPQRRYLETLEMRLDPHHPARSSFWLVPSPQLEAAMEREPEDYAGRLFAIATRWDGARFVAVPDRRGQVGQLNESTRRMRRKRVHELARRETLTRRDPADQQPSSLLPAPYAGWRFLP